eukprot:c9573_g1_i2.p3 GENE.c9573_g1_i2~~c9573_g1_i2.p3  ORF type:complete len:181 (-),score=55.21 c9573_g1_i2:82-624(-)
MTETLAETLNGVVSFSLLGHFCVVIDLVYFFLCEFLHRLLRKHRSRISGGVVHSFTGSVAELKAHLDLGMYVGINGCSLKTEDNIAAVRELPLDRLMLETDAPWCEIRGSSAASGHVVSQWPVCKKESFEMGKCVKSRQEPCHMRQVLEVVAAVKGLSQKDVADAAYQNTMKLFFSGEKL